MLTAPCSQATKPDLTIYGRKVRALLWSTGGDIATRSFVIRHNPQGDPDLRRPDKSGLLRSGLGRNVLPSRLVQQALEHLAVRWACGVVKFPQDDPLGMGESECGRQMRRQPLKINMAPRFADR